MARDISAQLQYPSHHRPASSSSSSAPAGGESPPSGSSSSVRYTILDYISRSTTAQHLPEDVSLAARAFQEVLDNVPASVTDLSDQQQARLAEVLISDLDLQTGQPGEGQTKNYVHGWDVQTRLSALMVLKEVGRLPGGSRPAATTKGLLTLVRQIDFPPPPTLQELDHWQRIRAYSGGHSVSSFHSDASSLVNGHIPRRASAGVAHSATRSLARAFGKRPSLTPPPSKRGVEIAHANSKQDESSDSAESSYIDPASGAHPLPAPAPPQPLVPVTSTSKSLHSHDWRVTDVALRCLNNALFLREDARLPFAVEAGGGEAAVRLLENPHSTPPDIIFLAGRLLFFATLFENPFNKIAVEELRVPDKIAIVLNVIADGLIDHRRSLRSSNSSSNEKLPALQTPEHVQLRNANDTQLYTAATEVLKALFNINLYYPRLAISSGADDRPIVGEAFHPSLESTLDPVIRLLLALPSTHLIIPRPPLTNLIGVLLNYPIAPYRSSWFGHAFGVPVQASEEKPTSARRFIAQALFSNPFANASLPNSTHATPISSHSASSSTNGLDLETEEQRRPSLSLATGEDGADRFYSIAPPLLSRLVLVLDRICTRYFACADPDDPAVKERAKGDGVELEETMQPLLLLLRKIATENSTARRLLRIFLVPSDIDRSVALHKRADTTGRVIRLMSAILLPQCARAAGEFLLALCEGDPKLMTAEFGYGPCAGFLANSNLAAALPSQAAPGAAPMGAKAALNVASGERTINPITGEFNPTAEELAKDPINLLSVEEKEAEADKLFSLFDRLNRTGVVKVQDPRETAIAEGRFEELQAREDEDRAKDMEKQRQQDEADEEEVMKEMAQRKARQEEARRRAQKLAGGH